ncbi:hypothetical protein D9757_005268 [Collybiopsis confluens]|uniref:Uncharacterized protein n=1 Tax=Collybiopsis confluens TaxID=2823264 RepID=A0A8H5ME22_9AGAR|nr:hypothetical protein D9757_005268 [Collybiopsis confluens]
MSDVSKRSAISCEPCPHSSDLLLDLDSIQIKMVFNNIVRLASRIPSIHSRLPGEVGVISPYRYLFKAPTSSLPHHIHCTIPAAMSGIGEASLAIAGTNLLIQVIQKGLLYVDKKRPDRIVKQARDVIQSKEVTDLLNRLIDLDPKRAEIMEGERNEVYQQLEAIENLCASGSDFWSLKIRLRWAQSAKKSFKSIQGYRNKLRVRWVLQRTSADAEWEATHRRLQATGYGYQGEALFGPDISSSNESVTQFEDVHLGNFESDSIHSLIDLQYALAEQLNQAKASIPCDAQVQMVADIHIDTEDGTLQHTLFEPLDSGRTSPVSSSFDYDDAELTDLFGSGLFNFKEKMHNIIDHSASTSTASSAYELNL